MNVSRWFKLLLGLENLTAGPFALMAGPGSGDGFQSFVNKELPPGVAGDFAGANIRANVVAGQYGYAATPAGVTIGVGAWANDATKLASNYFQPNSFRGFVHRDGQALITTFLGVASMGILPGDMVTVMDQGDFWGLFAAGATPGQKVYFDPQTGALTANATGNALAGTNTAGASIAANVLTTTDADQTGSALAVGQIVTGPGIPPGTYIASAAGTGSGTHLWNLLNLDGTAIPAIAGPITAQNWGVQESQFYVASTVVPDCDFTASLAVPAAGTAYGVLTVTAVASGVLTPDQWLSATGLPGSANTKILQQLTSTASGGALGSTGTYLTTNTFYTIGSTNTFVATQGKLGRISSWLRAP